MFTQQKQIEFTESDMQHPFFNNLTTELAST
jgi:hypothetical protein